MVESEEIMSNPYSRIRRAKRRKEAESQFEDASPVTLTSEPCSTCDGTGVVGGFESAEGGYRNDPCPDCDGSGVAKPQEG